MAVSKETLDKELQEALGILKKRYTEMMLAEARLTATREVAREHWVAIFPYDRFPLEDQVKRAKSKAKPYLNKLSDSETQYNKASALFTGSLENLIYRGPRSEQTSLKRRHNPLTSQPENVKSLVHPFKGKTFSKSHSKSH